MQYEKIIYSCIIRKKHTILTEYTDCSGNFSQITKGIMDEVINVKDNEPEKYKAKFFYGRYNFHVLKDNSIYILIMTKPPKVKIDNDTLFYNFLSSVHDELSKKINFENPGKLRQYSLTNFSDNLKTKVTLFNNGEIKFNEMIIKKQNSIKVFETLDDKTYNEQKQFPILSNAQVHADNNINKLGSFDSITGLGETVDSFNDDILKSTLLPEPQNNVSINDDELPFLMNEIDSNGGFDLNFKEKKRKKIWPKIVILIIIFFIILVLLDIFVFKLVIKI